VAGLTAPRPRDLGFRQPAEWAPHRATWLAWPHHAPDWPGKIAAIRWVYGEIVKKLAPGEEVCMIVPSARAELLARSVLERSGVDLARVTFLVLRTDRGWMRDTSPSFVISKEGEVAAIEWEFNGWAKYPNHERDRRIASFVAETRGMRNFRPETPGEREAGGARAKGVVLEGGSLDLDGRGTMLTTEECLLSDVQQRNPKLSRADLEALFADYLGVDKVLWLGRGIAGDDTHGHVDDLARFVRPGVVVLVAEDDPRDENYAPLRDNWERLQSMTDAAGNKLEVIKLPMPSPVFFEGIRLPASYANFYIGNERVLVPTFNDRRDREALGILSELFPTREVVGIHAVDLVWGLGTLHCMSHEEPG
jgi:agmatine deiminase